MCKFLNTLSILLFCFVGAISSSQNINLKVVGDDTQGYNVAIYNGNQLLVKNTEEFSLDLANTDFSEKTSIKNWTGAEWKGDSNNMELTRKTYLKDFDLNISVTVSYEVINKNIVKKKIDITQTGMPIIYYTLTETSKPAQTPSKYLTFEYDNFPGGFAHEMFPSAGFVTPNNLVVGFLMDAGYKNHYTRTTRRRFNGHGGGFVGMRKLPDPNLVSVATLEERAKNQNYIKQTFGELYNLDSGKELKLQLNNQYKKVGSVEISKNDSIYKLNIKSNLQSGFEMIAPFKDQKVYTVSFLCKGSSPLALKLFRIKNGKKTVELENGIKYIDKFPTQEKEWTLFKGSILVPYIENDSVSLFIGASDAKDCSLQIKNLQIVAHEPVIEPYNKIAMGETVTKTTYIFVEPFTNHHDFVISSQTRLAEAKKFEGSQIEKMMYANFNMLTWITSIDDFSPFNVPNMNYSPDMYNRDSFFSIVSSYNKELNLSIWNKWAQTQNQKGAVGTIITPYMGSIEVKDNEATIQFLIWAMMNKRRFGVELPKDKIEKAVDFVLNEFDDDKDGKCKSHFPLCQVDVLDFNPKTDRLAVNQGMLAITLRTIKELGYEISDSYIEKAEAEYRNFYDAKRKHLLYDKQFPDIIALTDLEPEFYSLWLFKRPILTDEMVVNHLNQIPLLNKVANSPHPEYGTTAPLIIQLTKDKNGYSFMNTDYQPFGEFGKSNYVGGANDGIYYNGGSWFRAEYCAYVVGAKHGWKNAQNMMENRAWAEINLNPEWPYSKEFIPTKWTTTDSWWPSTRGLCWNVFILMADEVAGSRTSKMDPDFENKN
ncbi:hypothetical protein C8C85_3402 [Flavobacterium sp. 103]|uniref:hypothetical protein n=1 Tax=Flavobacterium sp. 103 TaxID=2135624 RepID=UPI000D5E6CCA|nr:hypothetical protein [Flavobacterium sp. 103]PVX47459.1 hypothetical protein C8C85_3402 [Flavobacterium sp. 103]